MKSWNRTELFDSTNSVQGLLTGRLRRWSIVYAQNSMFIWENGNAFSGPPQPPHLHIRVHRSYSQLIKSDYLSYCRAVMCLKNLFSNLGSKLIVFHALYMVPYILGESSTNSLGQCLWEFLFMSRLITQLLWVNESYESFEPQGHFIR